MGRISDSAPAPGQPALGLSVAFVGEAAFAALSTGVRSILVRPSSDGALRSQATGGLDVLVVDAEPSEFDRTGVKRLVEEARSLGAGVVGVGGETAAVPAWHGLVDLALDAGGQEGDAPTIPFAAPIDPRVTNPCDFAQEPEAGLAAVVSPDAPAADLSGVLRAVRTAAGGPIDVVLPPGAGYDLPPGLQAVVEPLGGPQLLRRLQTYGGVLDHPGLHAGPAARAALLIRLAAGGVPAALVDDSGAMRELLSPELGSALASISPADLGDTHARERASVSVRRAALRSHSFAALWRRIAGALGRPVVQPARLSVLLATRRQRFLDHAIEQVNRQSYRPREAVVVLHGDDFLPDVESMLEERIDGPVSVVRADGRLPLGDALNMGVEAASGELIAKLDDDDWYSDDHLWDLVLAHEYSGAALVGKAPEFLYLADLGITLRRFGSDAETANRRIASGGLLVRRDTLIEVGGWAAVRRREQAPLITAVAGASQKVHRTHGFGYLVNRHGGGHTWDPEVDYFLVQSERQWRGLAAEAAGV